jgi:hypothetical protein
LKHNNSQGQQLPDMDYLNRVHFESSQKKLKKEFDSKMEEADTELKKGIKEDEKFRYQQAIWHYSLAIRIMEDLSEMVKEEEPKKEIQDVSNEYKLRVQELTDYLNHCVYEEEKDLKNYEKSLSSKHLDELLKIYDYTKFKDLSYES